MYYVVRVGKGLDDLKEDLSGPHPTYRVALEWMVDNLGWGGRATVIRR